MRRTRLYSPEPLQCGSEIKLDRSASHHLVRVLRHRTDDFVIVFNGNGNEYSAQLLDENPKSTSLHIEQELTPDTESPIEIVLLQGISRGDRMDITVQKATELGVTEIVPVQCEHTSIHLSRGRSEKKQQHWQQIAIHACEQSGRCLIPSVSETVALKDALGRYQTETKLALHPGAGQSLKQIDYTSKKIILLSGPEGGLSESEYQLAVEQGFIAVHIGPRILRTETAAPACIAALQALIGDSG